jgi:hypothetical protein
MQLNGENSNQESKPFTYLIGWKCLNIYYYGVRYSKDSDPNQLWISYFTSSKYVREFVEKNGDPDIIQVRKVFSCPNKAREWERRVLMKINAVDNDKFLNKGIPARGFGLSNVGVNNPFYNKTHTQMSRKKMSIARAGVPKDPEWKARMSALKKGKKRPEICGALHGRARKVVINNIEYNTVKEAAEAHGVTTVTIRNWEKRDKNSVT